jgi:hypothetical protein
MDLARERLIPSGMPAVWHSVAKVTSLVPLQRSDQLVTLWAETLAVAWAAAYADSDLEAGRGRSGTKRTRDVCSWPRADMPTGPTDVRFRL